MSIQNYIIKQPEYKLTAGNEISNPEPAKIINTLYVGYIILSSGMAASFYRSVYSHLILFTLSALFIFLYGGKINRNFYISCLLWFVYIIVSFFNYPGDNLYWPFLYFVNFTIVYAFIKRNGLQLFKTSEKVIYFFTLTSLVFFIWQIIDVDSIISVWQKIDIAGNVNDNDNILYYHSLFYTVINLPYLENLIFPRNAGFCWEPGPFSCFIIIGIFLLIAQNNFSTSKSAFRLIIYVLALLSTQSTTGILAFFVLILWYFTNRFNNMYIKLALLPVVGVLLFTSFYFVPFLGEKINSQLNTNLNEVAIETSASNYSHALDRFSSLKVTFAEFIDNPMFGFGADPEARWSAKKNIDVIPTSGIGNILAQYGLFGMIPFLLLLYFSSRTLADIFDYRGALYFFLVIIIFGFSFNIIETHFFLSLIMFSFFNDKPLSGLKLN